MAVRNWMLIIGLVLVVVSGCGLREPAPPEDSIPPAEYTPSLTASLTLPPSPTLPPIPTATITETVTIAPSLTLLPTYTVTVGPDFALLKVKSVSVTSSGLLLRLYLPGVNQAYPIRVEGRPYDCVLDKKYPDYLFCHGPMFKTGEYIPLEVLSINGGDLLFTTYFAVSKEALYTATPVGTNRTWCPLRGTNVTCETENRTNELGNPCIVSTCFDACGYYYSINTCPDTPSP